TEVVNEQEVFKQGKYLGVCYGIAAQVVLSDGKDKDSVMAEIARFCKQPYEGSTGWQPTRKE
ncbi:MAG: hypothetical protein KAV87_66300, partial [Desulfobacteraceae bacterium]|nr:hypothetical protein [Desulfobacteraceae bacterium]